MRNIWHQFGLRLSPFFDQPLEPSEESPYSIKLYVPRGSENNILDRIASGDNSVSVIESLPGGGKTTLINYVKYKAAKAGYLVGDNHVRITSMFSPTHFATATLFNIVQPLYASKKDAALKSPAVQEARAIIDGATGGGGWTFGIQGTTPLGRPAAGAGVGVNVGKERPTRGSGLVEHARLHALVRAVAADAVRLGFKGTVVHVNNLELAAFAEQNWPAQLFNDIRDDLQIPGIHFVIGASRGFVAEHLASQARVASILQHPIDLPPLDATQIRKLLEKRYDALKLSTEDMEKQGVSFQEPIAWDAVERMHDTFNGDLRAMFSAFKDAMERRLSVAPQPMGFAEAVGILRPEYASVLRDLPRASESAVKRLAKIAGPFTQADLRKELKKSQPRISQIFKELQERDLVVQVGGPKPLKYNFSGKAKIALGLAG